MSSITGMKKSGLEIIKKLREEPFNKDTERRLQTHPYLKAAEEGKLTLAQRQAFAREQYHIQLSDAISFAFLAGHTGFLPQSLTNASVPEPKASSSLVSSEDTVDLFQFLLGGEVYAASLLLDYAKAVGLDEESLQRSSSQSSAMAQAYPSYWARIALSRKRAAGAASCAVNFPAWGAMCGRLYTALKSGNYGYANNHEKALAFIKFFATPIEDLDMMAAVIIEKEGVSYEQLVESVRLLQEFEVMFWDGVFEHNASFL